MHLFLRLRRLWRCASAQGWGLLRILFLWVSSVSSRPGQPIVLRYAEQSKNDEVGCMNGRADWTRGVRGGLTWGIPVALLVISPERYLFIVWPTMLTFMGVMCLLNAYRCGRVHCYFTGPFFLVLACLGLLYGIGVLPLGARGWSQLSLALLIGSVALLCVSERILGRYRHPPSSHTPN